MQVADWGAKELSVQLRSIMLDVFAKPFVDVRSHIEFLLASCQRGLGKVRVSLWVFERGRQRLCLRAVVDEADFDTSIPSVIERQNYPDYFNALAADFTIDANDALTDPRTAQLAADYLIPQRIKSLLDSPVRSLGSSIGVLCVEHQERRRWELAEQSFVAGVAAQISLALERDELSLANQSLVHRVLYDPLTELPNALYLDDYLKESLGDLMRGGDDVALLYADVEQFLLICNSLGQALAQDLLRSLAIRLRSIVGESGRVFRAGDDDFALVFRGQDGERLARHVAGQLLNAMKEPLRTQGREISCSLSLGIALRDAQAGDFNSESLLREGWTASRAARRTGAPKEFSRTMLVRVALEVELEQELRRALRESQFEPHFQPIMDLNIGQVYSFESLMRWRHPTRGVVTPVEFLAIAQRSGLMVQLGRALFEKTVQAFAAIQKRFPERHLSVHFNLSSPEFLRSNICEDIAETLKRFAVDPGHLVIEITESVAIDDLARAQDVIRGLHQMGIQVQLDDFGTGFSSLNYLRILAIDCIKMDQEFVHDIERNPRSVSLIRALVELSRDLGQQPIAEGVEWKEQLQKLVALGVRRYQGYLLSHPREAIDITREFIEAIEADAPKLG
jgi:diguanylate cyclase (GGDEF)-like protein